MVDECLSSFDGTVSPYGSNGCVDRATIAAAGYSPFAAPEYNNGVKGCDQLRADAKVVEAVAESGLLPELDRLSQLLPASRGHVLEPWAAYWELRVRLQEATQDEVQSFLTRWALAA